MLSLTTTAGSRSSSSRRLGQVLGRAAGASGSNRQQQSRMLRQHEAASTPCSSASSFATHHHHYDHHHHHHQQQQQRSASTLARPPLPAQHRHAPHDSHSSTCCPPSCSFSTSSSSSSSSSKSPPQPKQRRHKSSSASLFSSLTSLTASFPPSYAPSSSPPGGATFVSKYYQIELGDVMEFLHRKDFLFRETATHLIVKECPFCHKPTMDKADNYWKLYIARDGAAWFCHRCGAKGSWFDFKRRLSGAGAGSLLSPGSPEMEEAEATWGSVGMPAGRAGGGGGGGSYLMRGGGRAGGMVGASTSTSSISTNGSGNNNFYPRQQQQQQSQPQQQQQRSSNPSSSSSSSSSSPLSQVELGQRLREYQYALMDDPSHRHVRDWLTGTGEGQRGLSPTVLRKYGVGCATFSFMNDQNVFEPAECVVFPWMVPVATPAAAAAATSSSKSSPPTTTWVPRRCKIRAMKQKAWQRLYPSPSSGWGLFGLHTVAADSTEIILTEGEFDAMAVYQATGRAAVSLPNGCRSLPVEVLPLLERFERILLWMDSDSPGVEGAEKFAHKLGVRRTFIVRPLPDELAPAKDANEALLRGMDLEKMIQNAKRLPDNRIIKFSDLRPLVFDELRNKDKHEGVPAKSFPALMGLMKGFRKGEMTVLTGPTGAGKTTFLSQLSLDLASGGMNTLWGSFEVQNVKLVEKMMRQYHAAPLPMGDPKGLDAVADRFGQLPLMFMRFHGSSNLEEVMDAMEYCAYVYDTSLVILDNLQFMMAMGGAGREGGGEEGGIRGGLTGFIRWMWRWNGLGGLRRKRMCMWCWWCTHGRRVINSA